MCGVGFGFDCPDYAGGGGEGGDEAYYRKIYHYSLETGMEATHVQLRMKTEKMRERASLESGKPFCHSFPYFSQYYRHFELL